MATRQITLPGQVLGQDGTIVPGEIKINLDDQDGIKGQSINQDVWEQLVNKFANQDLRPNEAAHYLIDRQLLEFILSSENCQGLLISKCTRQDGRESLAVLAVDGANIPLRWRGSGKLQGDEDGDVSGGEWIQGLTKEDIQKFLKQGEFLKQYNFDELISAIKNL
jgi:hypothetical protein